MRGLDDSVNYTTPVYEGFENQEDYHYRPQPDEPEDDDMEEVDDFEPVPETDDFVPVPEEEP